MTTDAPEIPAPTSRLVFRVWRIDDIDLALGLWGDERVTAHIDARGRLDSSSVRQRLNDEIERQRDHGIQYWPIFLRTTGEHVGACGLRPRDPDRVIFEIGFHLRVHWWGHGLATEAARQVVAFAFDRLGATALFAGHNPNNVASRSTLTRLGFRHTHDELYPPTGLHHPSYLLTQAEYRQGRATCEALPGR